MSRGKHLLVSASATRAVPVTSHGYRVRQLTDLEDIAATRTLKASTSSWVQGGGDHVTLGAYYGDFPVELTSLPLADGDVSTIV